MLKRNMYDILLELKKNKGTKYLLIKGVRQVGMTYLISLSVQYRA